MVVQSRDEDAPVTIATYPNPHEAYLDRAALESLGVAALVQSDHGQYSSIASWVQLQVARRDRELACEVLDRGPLLTSEAELAPASDATDDLRPARLKRRFVLARWFLFASAMGLCLASWITAPLILLPLGLALWSKKQPRYAFGTAYFIQIAFLFVSIALGGISGLMALIPLAAYYWAWIGAAPDPPDELLASPYPKTREIEIGQAWKDDGANREPAEHPLWMLQDLGVFALILLLTWASLQAIKIG
jgi:hypothetical protein